MEDTWTFQKIVERCKASVSLTANQHRDYYQSLADYIDEDANRNKKYPRVDTELRKNILEANIIYELQFYPDTPVGFYRVYGTSMEEVITKAGAILDRLS